MVKRGHLPKVLFRTDLYYLDACNVRHTNCTKVIVREYSAFANVEHHTSHGNIKLKIHAEKRGMSGV